VLFRTAQYFQSLNPALYQLNLHQLVKETCDLFLLSSLEEITTWVAASTQVVSTCTIEDFAHLVAREALHTKRTFNRAHVPSILAHFKEYHPELTELFTDN
jgi:hypothetical protein